MEVGPVDLLELSHGRNTATVGVDQLECLHDEVTAAGSQGTSELAEELSQSDTTISIIVERLEDDIELKGGQGSAVELESLLKFTSV